MSDLSLTSDKKKTTKSKKRSEASDDTSELQSAQKKQHIKSEDSKLTTLASVAAPSPTDSASKGNNKLTASSTGHRPVTSCTHCRQHKIKCNASDNFPAPCSRCERMGLHCEIDPQFRPKKGSQLQSLRNDVDELKLKIEYLTHNESLIARALQQSSTGQQLLQALKSVDFSRRIAGPHQGAISKPRTLQSKVSVQTYLASEPHLLQEQTTSRGTPNSSTSGTTDGSHYSDRSGPPSKYNLPQLLNDSVPTNNTKDALPPVLQIALKRNSSVHTTPHDTPSSKNSPLMSSPHSENNKEINNNKAPIIATTNTMPLLPSPHANIDEFVIGDVQISISKANELHDIFVRKFLPYFPIMCSDSATELYGQSQLLFWTVMLTACLSEPEPTLYNQLASLIKQLAIETCWIRTPRSTHISQALLILCNWPLPNQKVLDDCSYRFVGLAKSLSFQLGLHRGEFMSEFTRTQTSLPDAEKWRTRTWLGIFFAEQCWASILGLPPTSQTDYLIENARLSDDENAVPKRLRQLICLANFQAKLCNVMGSSVTSPDGLMDARERAGALAILERELERLDVKLKFQEDTVVEMYFLYVKLTICCYAFLPGTPTEDQTKYVTEAYLCATRVITLLTKLLEHQNLIELPIYIRQSVTYSALILFKLQLTPLLLDKYLDSARQSIVTVHRLFRNQLTAWATSVENDISRTASVLEKLNFVLITCPEVFIEEEGIISRMRSHLTGTLFYDLVWCVHEARRRQMDPAYNEEAVKKAQERRSEKGDDPMSTRKLYPLPFYNQISKEDFETVTQTTPGGTTVTTLVPTKKALKQAKKLAKSQGDVKRPISHINGIPLSVLDETGSVKFDQMLEQSEMSNVLSPRLEVHTPGETSSHTANSASKIESLSRPSPVNLAQTMQRSVSTSVAESMPARKRAAMTSSSIMTGNPNSLFIMNNSVASNLSLNRALSSDIPAVTATSANPSRQSSYSNLNIFLTNDADANGTNPHPQQLSELDNFFQQQSAGWIEGNSSNDDFLGWFDMNMAPEF
ncbi:LAFE_0B01552g1_1 [Lachancea fermentati]|uniref:LAFE_0B01552g1_1 n=1 Tax=Lachancea fermentati TaxID=4955 RepID=A0A1G4M7G6_LACFM|nr:LAFE_0B01552g1_1 [Lachancea fermentati]